MVRWSGLVAVAGCTFGGGPTIGLRLDNKDREHHRLLRMRPDSNHGPRLVLGAEAAAGLGFFQLVAGFAGAFGFGRLDLTFDPIVVGSNHESQGLAGRFGLGAGGDRWGAAFTFDTGLGGERAFGDTSQCNRTHAFGVVTLDLRYARGWQLVLAPRIEGVNDVCSH